MINRFTNWPNYLMYFNKQSIYLTLLWQMLALHWKFREKVYFKSQILVHEYWTILNHFGIPVLFASGCHQHVLKNINITFSGNTGAPEMFQYLPILVHSSIWDLKYTFSFFRFQLFEGAQSWFTNKGRRKIKKRLRKGWRSIQAPQLAMMHMCWLPGPLQSQSFYHYGIIMAS